MRMVGPGGLEPPPSGYEPLALTIELRARARRIEDHCRRQIRRSSPLSMLRLITAPNRKARSGCTWTNARDAARCQWILRSVANLSIEPDEPTRTNIAVARNTATRIEGLSIAGKHGYFEDLDASFRDEHPHLELARSETDVEQKYVDTRLLLQILWALMPEELAPEHRRTMEARMSLQECRLLSPRLHGSRRHPRYRSGQRGEVPVLCRHGGQSMARAPALENP